TMTLSFYFLVRALDDRPHRSPIVFAAIQASFVRPVRSFWFWAGYVTFSILAVHTHYYAAFALLAQNIFVLLWHRNRLGRWIIAQAIIAVGTLPWLYLQYKA